MAILTRDEFFTRLHERLGEDTSDESISFLEDMTDTFNDLERKANGDGVDWEMKYKELDETWKKRYRHRFFTGKDTNVTDRDTSFEETEEYDADDVKIDDLFTEKRED